MSEPFSLRKPRKPPDAATAPPPEPKLPFRPGDLILTDQEREDLEVVGYEPGDPLPGDLPQLLDRARRAIGENAAREVERRSRSGHVLKPPPVKAVSDLPPEHKAEIDRAMASARKNIDYVELQRQELAALGQMDPSVRRAILAARGGDNGGVEVFRDEPAGEELGDDWAAFDRHPAAAEEKGHALPREHRRDEQPGGAPDPAQTARPPAAAGAEAGRSPETPANCPHCNWAYGAPDPTEPSAGDVLAFATSVFTDVPFLKVYEFLGGKIRLTLKTATVEQLEACFTQISLDTAAGKIVSLDDFWRYMYDYRLAFAIDKVYANGRTIDVARAVAAAQKDPSPAGEGEVTILPALVRKLTGTPPMRHEMVWRQFGLAWKQFNTLIEKLEARMRDPTFWNAIGV